MSTNYHDPTRSALYNMEQVQNNNMWSNTYLTSSPGSEVYSGDTLINNLKTNPSVIDRRYDYCKCNGIFVNDELVCICMTSTKPTVQYCQLSDSETAPNSIDRNKNVQQATNSSSSFLSSYKICNIQVFNISEFNKYESSYTKNLFASDQRSARTNPNTNQTNARHTPEQSHSCVNHACTSQCTLCLQNNHCSCHTHTHMQPSSIQTNSHILIHDTDVPSQTKKRKYDTIDGSDDQNDNKKKNNITQLFPGFFAYKPIYLIIENDALDQMIFKYVINIHHGDIIINNNNKEYCSSNLFIQKNLSFINVSDTNLVCLNYEKIFKESLSDIQHKPFLEEFNKFKLGQDFLDAKVEKILLLLKKTPILYRDPFYVWKIYHTIDINIMQFYYVQTCGDEIYNIINNYEKIVIAKLFDENYIKGICTDKIALTQTKIWINRYINLILTKTINSNKNNYLNIEITKTDFFKNKMQEFINDLNASSLKFEKKEYNEYYESIFESLDGIKILDSFQFDSLYKIASTEATKISNPLLEIEFLCLKSFLLDILRNCGESFLLFFPEIVVIVDYLEKSSVFQFQLLNNTKHYKILFMLKVLSDIVQYDWYDIYKAKRNVKYNIENIDYFYIKSAYFSLIKYEITKLLSYCLICFIPEERYKYYAETRILEQFYLYSGTTIPYNNLPNRTDIYYRVGKFNVIARLLFIYETEPCNLVKRVLSISKNESIFAFLINSFTRTAFLTILKVGNNQQTVYMCLKYLDAIKTKKNSLNTYDLNLKNHVPCDQQTSHMHDNNQPQINEFSINANFDLNNTDVSNTIDKDIRLLFDHDENLLKKILNPLLTS
ncbi:hypothetical protein COBT_000615 [Conglomerata obtusa]